jgi:predicted nuclease of predicted toxin-antitoxin system
MKFLLDENFPKTAANFLGDHGHECFDVRGTELEGQDDAALVEEAQRREAIILTTDRDFYHTLRHQYPDHAGVVVIALKQPNRQSILERLKWVLANVREDAYSGRAFQLRDRTWVAQPPLPE